MINNDIINSIQARREYEQTYGELGLMQAYDQQISDLQDKRRQAELFGQFMFSKLTIELPVNKLNVNVDVQEEYEDNNNVSEIDPVTDNSASQSNICWCSSPD